MKPTFRPLIVSCSENPDVYRGESHRVLVEDIPEGQIIADIDTGEHAQKYAQLFVVAPKLLEVCKELMTELMAIGNHNTSTVIAMNNAEAVIAEAEGQ